MGMSFIPTSEGLHVYSTSGMQSTASIQKADFITSINGLDVNARNFYAVKENIEQLPVGASYEIIFSRNGHIQDAICQTVQKEETHVFTPMKVTTAQQDMMRNRWVNGTYD